MINLAEWIYAVKDLKKYGRSDSIKEFLDNSRGKKLGSLLDNISKSILQFVWNYYLKSI